MATRPVRALIIEGDADDDALIASYLASPPDAPEPVVLAHASRLSSACQLLERQEFDVVLLDLALPQASGLDAFHRIRALRPRVPVILLTGARDESLAASAVTLGARDYFIKGSPDCLLLRRAIRYAIESERLSGEVEDLLAADAAPKAVLDAKGVVRFANAAVAAALGRAPADLVGKPFARLAPPDGRAPASEVPISWHGAPARLVSLQEEAPQDRGGDLGVVEARNHFLGRISHELRNTLATMKTAAYCLKDDASEKLSPRQAPLVDMIARNIDRQARIVENILDLARLRSGKLRIELQAADPAAIIADLAQEYRMSRGAQLLQIAVDAGLPRVECDPDLIAQVLRNLVDNALRYAKRRIAIAASKAGEGRITISVTDDGTGIPEDRLGGLFTRFQRLDEGEAGGHKGTGLGLAICREIVEGHRGRIRAENAAGSGARFSFDLPVSGAKTAPAAERPCALPV